MIFYHVTLEENANDIIKNGFKPVCQNENDRYKRDTKTLSGTDVCGVYFFIDEYDAETFLCDNNSDMNKIILEVEADFDYILDPEYDGSAVFVKTNERLKAYVNYKGD